MKNDTPYSRALDELCPSLHLDPIEQDWAIVAADASRIDEFISFYDNTPSLSSLARDMLFDLILASISDLLEADSVNPSQLDRIAFFIQRVASRHPHELNYWTGTEPRDPQQTRIARWLTSVLEK